MTGPIEHVSADDYQTSAKCPRMKFSFIPSTQLKDLLHIVGVPKLSVLSVKKIILGSILGFKFNLLAQIKINLSGLQM